MQDLEGSGDSTQTDHGGKPPSTATMHEADPPNFGGNSPATAKTQERGLLEDQLEHQSHIEKGKSNSSNHMYLANAKLNVLGTELEFRFRES